MLDEEMDHIIREAADKHHPVYNDKAWEKMEMKLDRHLPQKKDRRKFIFFLLLFLLLGGGTFFAIIYFNGDTAPVAEKVFENGITENKKAGSFNPKEKPGSNNIDAITRDADLTAGPATTKSGNDLINISQQNEIDPLKESRGTNKKDASVSKGRSNIRIIAAVPSDEPAMDERGEIKNNKPLKRNADNKISVAISGPDPEKNENVASVPSENNSEMILIAEEKKKALVTVKDTIEKELVIPEVKSLSPTDKRKPKSNFAGNFGLTFSAGPDLGFIEINKLGNVTLTYGAGISYNFLKKMTVRTGFYYSKKIYSATPYQYHTPGGVTYPNLTSVDADCKVYEIPVSLGYNFGKRKNHSWFGNVGLSTFLMKSENYIYRYKTAAGQTYNYTKQVNNENKHYFAVLTLSGGYQYHFSKRISLQAEPYFKLPLSGIGLGKIKLNSSGVLFTLTVKPFVKGK